MASVKYPHYIIRKGRGYWYPTRKMRELGFEPVSCGPHSAKACAIAEEWEQRYQRVRRGEEKPPRVAYPIGSVGDGFERFRRTNEWSAKPPRTREDWDRGWKYIEPAFGEFEPSEVSFEALDSWYAHFKNTKGPGEAGRALKIWRALYRILAGMKLCEPDKDPSLSIRKTSVPGRTQTWRAGEVVRLIKGAWRSGHRGLACIIAVAWDTGFSPVDVRTLTPSQAVTSGTDMAFTSGRAKTGEAAFGTLTRRTQRLVEAYVEGLDYDLHDNAEIFRTKGYAPSKNGGRPRLPVPYTKDSLIDDFADVRRSVLGPDERRRLMDMRRTGAVEANAGGATVETISAKMANSIDQNRKLQKTYMPVNIAAVRAADEARKVGRRRLESGHSEFKKLDLGKSKTA